MVADLSVVIPCYNEEEGIAALCSAISEMEVPFQIEFVLVDNGSTDNTWESLKSHLGSDQRCILIHESENRGYGGGICVGLHRSSGDFLAWTHADLQTDLVEVTRAYSALQYNAGNSVAKGVREGRPRIDQILSQVMSVLLSILFRSRLGDINGQPTVVSRAFFESWHNPPDDFSLDLYVLVTAKKSRAGVKRFPVMHRSRNHGVSSWSRGSFSRLRLAKRTLGYSLHLLRNSAS